MIEYISPKKKKHHITPFDPFLFIFDKEGGGLREGVDERLCRERRVHALNVAV